MGVEWKPEARPCPICGSSEHKRIGQRGGRAHWAKLGTETTVVRCRECGTFYQSPALIPEGNPYTDTPDDYFAHQPREVGVRSGRYIAEKAAKILGRTGTLIDIGCGRGDFLLGAKSTGWDVSGVEMTPSFADVAEEHGIPVQRARIEDAVLSHADVIVFSGVLEHLYDPVSALRSAYDALPVGGLVFASVPNEASLVLRAGNAYMKARGWTANLSPTFPPFHVVGFTPKSLRLALYNSGFETVELVMGKWATCCDPGRRLASAGSALASWIGNKIGMGEGLDIWGRKVEH